MAILFEAVEMIETLDKTRAEAIKEKEAAQKELEKMFATYLYCLFNGIAPIRDVYAQMIKEHNEGIRVFLDFQVETFEKSSSLLKNLIVNKASDEELKQGLDEVERNLAELNEKAKAYLE